MSTSSSAIVAILSPEGARKQRRREALADEITELCGYINAATYRLLEMIRVFDQEDLFIDANTCVSQYDDARIDWDLAVGHMFQ